MVFTKAKKAKSKLRLALSGPSGAGKTLSALLMARGIAGSNGAIAVIDTENGSASLYADKVDFDVISLQPPYHPNNFIEMIKAAEDGGYDVLIIDSITHEWKGQGGILDIHQQITKTIAKGNSFMAWNKASPIHQTFVDAILRSKLHVICTMRSKTSYAQVDNNGRKSITKMGEAPEQRDGIEYEFTTVLDLNVQGNFATASKDRSGLFSPENPILITEETGQLLKDWVDTGEEPAETAWSPSPAFQQVVTKWINNASKNNKFNEAVIAVDDNFKDEKENSYIKSQLLLAQEIMDSDDEVNNDNSCF